MQQPPHKEHPHACNFSLWLYMLNAPSRMLPCWNQGCCGRGGLISPFLPISSLHISEPTSSGKRKRLIQWLQALLMSAPAVIQLYSRWMLGDATVIQTKQVERDWSQLVSDVQLMTQLFIWTIIHACVCKPCLEKSSLLHKSGCNEMILHKVLLNAMTFLEWEAQCIGFWVESIYLHKTRYE